MCEFECVEKLCNFSYGLTAVVDMSLDVGCRMSNVVQMELYGMGWDEKCVKNVNGKLERKKEWYENGNENENEQNCVYCCVFCVTY